MNVLTLLELAAALDGDRIALGPRQGGISYAELLDLAARTGAALGASDRLVLYADEATAALPVAFLGCAWAGRPFVPVSYRLADDRLRALVTAQTPAIVICGPAVCARLGQLRDADLVGPEDFLASTRATDPSGTRWPDDPELPALLLHTSGTTGTPKVAILRHRHLTSYVIESLEPMSAGPEEATLISVPPYHIAAMAAILSSLYSGRRIVQLPAFDPRAWVDVVRAESITHAMVVPTMLHGILPVLEDSPGLPSLRHLSYGGGRMPLPVIARALELLPGVDFVNAYGLTETSSTIAVLGPEDHRDGRRLGSVGRPLPTVEVEIRTADGGAAPAGEPGQVWVRGSQVSGEYSHGRATDDEGWFGTGDAGSIDADGYLFVEGRLDDVIVRGGENLSPGEIENVLLENPGIRDAAAFGVPDERWGELVAVAVVLADGHKLDADEVTAWVASRLRSSRAPAVVQFLPLLPRTETGKVLRRVLREQAAAQNG